MNRKEFIKTTCIACFGTAFLSTVLESCSITKHYNAEISGSDLLVPLNLFYDENKKQKHNIIVQNSKLQFPICVFKLNEKEYTALLMRCPHQGAELQVFGDKLQCPAHGSEFNNTGVVLSQPAAQNLRTFNTQIENEFLKISLK